MQVECGDQEEERIPDKNRNRDLGTLCAALTINSVSFDFPVTVLAGRSPAVTQSVHSSGCKSLTLGRIGTIWRQQENERLTMESGRWDGVSP